MKWNEKAAVKEQEAEEEQQNEQGSENVEKFVCLITFPW